MDVISGARMLLKVRTIVPTYIMKARVPGNRLPSKTWHHYHYCSRLNFGGSTMGLTIFSMKQ